MSFAILLRRNTFLINAILPQSEIPSAILCAHFSEQAKPKLNDEEFRILDFRKQKQQAVFKKRQIRKPETMPPRTNVMPVDQDWTNVWPGPRSFHPASVPLPLRQGYNQNGPIPGKFGNAELMKIPNFLHLTPPAIKKHCEALKRFCTPWPEALDTDEKCEKVFPMEVLSSDYCHSSPDIRDPLSRIVTIKLKLSRLELDDHARDKFLRLVEERYDPKTDVLTIVTDRCPYRQQNYEYALYLLTALFHESWKTEAWENEKLEADMEYYDWDKNISRTNILKLLTWKADGGEETKDFEQELLPKLQKYKEKVSNIFNNGEDEYVLSQYKEEVKKLLQLPQFPQENEQSIP